jgi:hypothetical protein
VFLTKIIDHGGRRGDAMRALASAARAMHPTSHRRIRMAIEIASDSPAFFAVVDSLFAHNVS